MKLYVRHRQGVFINFINDIQSFDNFEVMYIPGRKLVIGDLATFNKPMRYRLLKFIEANPEVDCYSSEDITDPILLSRFVEIIKDPLVIVPSHSYEEFKESKRDILSVRTLLSNLPIQVQLRACSMSDKQLQLFL